MQSLKEALVSGRTRKEYKEEGLGAGPGVSSLQSLAHPRCLTPWDWAL